jgi:hypothetical protein
MKQIRFIISGTVRVSPEGTDLKEAWNKMNAARNNKLKILEAALTIEDRIVSIISHWFFGRTHDRKSSFDSQILKSETCTFATKRRLLNDIIEQGGFLEAKEKDRLASSLRKVMSFRNAFAHGELSSDGSKVWLSYFERSPKEQELTDEFLTLVETALFETHDALKELALKTGTNLASSDDEPKKPIPDPFTHPGPFIATGSNGSTTLKITAIG